MPPPACDGFQCNVEPDCDRVVVRPVGEVDMATAPVIGEALRRARDVGFRDIVLDLQSVGFMDSSGLDMLLRSARAAARQEIRFTILADSRPVLRLLELTATPDRLPIADPGRIMPSGGGNTQDRAGGSAARRHK